MIKLPKLILASGSPRRSEILSSVGWEFRAVIRIGAVTISRQALHQQVAVRLRAGMRELMVRHLEQKRDAVLGLLQRGELKMAADVR